MSFDKLNSKNKNVNIKVNIDGEEHEVNWSESQASTAGFHSIFDHEEFPLSELIATVLKKNLPSKVDSKNNPRCPHCGLTFLELLEVGRMGCAHCYSAFGENMEMLLEKIHGSAIHVGIVPSQTDTNTNKEKPIKKTVAETEKTTNAEPELSQSEKLKLEMKKAIEAEDYENAARLRDELKKMEVASR